MSTRLGRRLGVLAATVLMLLGTSGVSHAAYIPYKLQNIGNSLCMDLGDTKAGTPVIISWCHFDGDYESQEWTEQDGNDNFINIATDMCLDIADTKPGSKVVISWCHFEPGYTSQKWVLTQYRLWNRATNLCADIGANTARTPLVLSWCHFETGDYASQLWKPVDY